ncbi:MAG: hypothetical protein J7K02_11315 [Deltaproteobacteria bacterium]|nr:hypothetical protein [Deltaproteobacteria bacterium]
MNRYNVSTINKARFSPPRPMDEYPKDAFKQMAVLFTDIVGSTAYFKSHGNIAGRKMLQTHQDLVSNPIAEHGGIFVKTLGDSVMAYFTNPRESVKSAIKIQQKFSVYNEKKAVEKQIHIRIGIHFGDAIVEESDIFGDAVNIAAKVVQIAESDQIFLSQELYDLVRDLSHGLFQLVDVSNKKGVSKEFTIYRILWQEAIAFALTTNILLYLKPLLNLKKANVEEAWNSLLEAKEGLWGGKIDEENILSDKSVVLVVKEPPFSITVAKDVLVFLKKVVKDYNSLPPPIQIIIDSSPYLSADKLTIESLEVNWDEIDPGEIYISPDAHRCLSAVQSFSTIPPLDTGQPQAFYKIILDGHHQKSKLTLFRCQDALIKGNNPPCYYCSDRRHLPLHCPSKQIMQTTDALKKLGYLSLAKINRLFYHYLSGADTDREESSNLLAYYGFYELKSVFQLRFFRTIWDINIEDWEKIKKGRVHKAKGGLVWLGQDCIRISSLDQAEVFLKAHMKKYSEDYKVYCAMGFLYIEKNNFDHARAYFDKALSYATTKPQQIFLLFLLSRLHDLNNETEQAEKKIKKIIHLYPQCPEAIYQAIVFKFRKGLGGEALSELIKLIEKIPQYYVNALIDPELAAFNDIVHPELKRLFDQAKKEANEIMPEAQDALERIKKVIGEEEKEIKQAQSIWSKIKELSKTDSYLGYIDITHYANSIISIAEVSIKERSKKIYEVLYELNHRCEEYNLFTNNFPYECLIRAPCKSIRLIQAKIKEMKAIVKTLDTPDGFRKSFAYAEGLSKNLDEIKLQLKRLDNIRKIFRFLSGFFKKSLVFQLCNFVISLILFPVVMYYLVLIMPRLGPHRDIWFYQKGFLIIGGIAGLFLAIVIAIRDLEIK